MPLHVPSLSHSLASVAIMHWPFSVSVAPLISFTLDRCFSFFISYFPCIWNNLECILLSWCLYTYITNITRYSPKLPLKFILFKLLEFLNHVFLLTVSFCFPYDQDFKTITMPLSVLKLWSINFFWQNLI
jgi:hypothetical protein